MKHQVLLGDCLEVLKTLPDNSVDSIVTDPPYGLSQQGTDDIVECLTAWMCGEPYTPKKRGFMGKDWDGWVPGPEIWRECLRVLKPGGHLLAFAGTRTQDLMTIGLRLAGFEIRDMLAWMYGSGFPKSLDVSKAIDKAAGAEREVVVGNGHHHATSRSWVVSGGHKPYQPGDAGKGEPILAPATPAAQQWDGWGTALKPALEPITVARKPLSESTVAANVLEWGTGALNIDGCRVGDNAGWSYPNGRGGSGWHGRDSLANNLTEPMAATQGRWPANLVHDGSDEVLALFPRETGKSSGTQRTTSASWLGTRSKNEDKPIGYNDTGSAARFFYCAKASRSERDAGLDGMPEQVKRGPMTNSNWSGDERFDGQSLPVSRNGHPTVKPVALMRWLCRLVTPPGGVVLDPFAGSGSTGVAAVHEGFSSVLIEREAEYVEIIQRRVAHAEGVLFSRNDD